MAQHVGDIHGFSGKPWPQYQREIHGFIALLKAEGVRSYLEVGCRYGDTWHAVGSALPEGSLLVGVDLPGFKSGTENKGSHQDSGLYLKRAAVDLRAKGRDAHVIIGDSHEQDTVQLTATFAPFDAALLDGDHSSDGITADWNSYGKMARMVAFHDIAGMGRWPCQVRPVYEKACIGRRHEEFIYDGLRRGIGVVWTC
jgi:hypothetical protein